MERILGRTRGELARLQLRLEYDLTTDGLLVPRAVGEERALCCLVVLDDRVLSFCRTDVPASIRGELARVDADCVEVALRAIGLRLGLAGPLDTRRFATSVLTEPFPRATWPDAELVGDRAVVRAPDGGEAAVAWSVRQDAHAAECGVETHEPYRRRGLARQVTAAWATHVLARGRVPFFSHVAANAASRALAASLGAVPVFEVVTLESVCEIGAKSGIFRLSTR